MQPPVDIKKTKMYVEIDFDPREDRRWTKPQRKLSRILRRC